jgi:SpoU rRNA methylase family enzyme
MKKSVTFAVGIAESIVLSDLEDAVPVLKPGSLHTDHITAKKNH